MSNSMQEYAKKKYNYSFKRKIQDQVRIGATLPPASARVSNDDSTSL